MDSASDDEKSLLQGEALSSDSTATGLGLAIKAEASTALALGPGMEEHGGLTIAFRLDICSCYSAKMPDT